MFYSNFMKAINDQLDKNPKINTREYREYLINSVVTDYCEVLEWLKKIGLFEIFLQDVKPIKATSIRLFANSIYKMEDENK